MQSDLDDEIESVPLSPRRPVHPDRVHADEDPGRTGHGGSHVIDREDRRVNLVADGGDEATPRRATSSGQQDPTTTASTARSRQTGTRSGVISARLGSGLERETDMVGEALLVPGREQRAADRVA